MSDVNNSEQNKSIMNIEKDKLWLPWRISDDNNKYINYSNIIVYYFHQVTVISK